MVKDALGRSWQLGTIQVDYNLPERFDLEYKGSDNEMHRPVMIHRVLLEHTGGNFPLWLMPEQAIILSLSEKYEKYAEKVLNELENHEIRGLEEGTVSVRKHGNKEDIGTLTIEEFVAVVKEEVSKTLAVFNG